MLGQVLLFPHALHVLLTYVIDLPSSLPSGTLTVYETFIVLCTSLHLRS